MTKNVIAIDIGYGNTKAVWSHSIDKLGKDFWGEIFGSGKIRNDLLFLGLQ